MKTLSFEHWLSFVLTGLMLLLLGSVDRQRLLPFLGLSEPVELKISPVPAIPIASTVLADQDYFSSPLLSSISAQAVYVFELESGTELFAKNADQSFHPASVTKLMTALVLKDVLPLKNEIEIVGSDILESNKIGLKVGERLTVEDLLKAMLISSSNEATEALARNYPDGYYALVSAMNAKAKEFGLTQTVFTNVVGYDHAQHLSTAREITLLAKIAISDEFLQAVVKEPKLVIQDVTGQYFHTLNNTNQLLVKDSRVTGIKTGTTQAAGEVFVAEYRESGHTIIVSVLDSQDRFADVTKIISWIAEEFIWYEPESLL